MKPVHETDLGQFLVDDCLNVLRGMHTAMVDLIITSPPYEARPRYVHGARHGRDWYETTFLEITREMRRVLKPHGSLVLNYRSKHAGDERGTLQYELVLWLRQQGWLFAEDFVWVKPAPVPGFFRRHLKDAVEYCFQFAKSGRWQFYPEQARSPARTPAARRRFERRYRNATRRTYQASGHRTVPATMHPDKVRPSTAISIHPERGRNPVRHPARFPVALPSFFITLLTKPGQLVLDPFAGTGTTAIAAERLGRRWLACEIEPRWARGLPDRLGAD